MQGSTLLVCCFHHHLLRIFRAEVSKKVKESDLNHLQALPVNTSLSGASASSGLDYPELKLQTGDRTVAGCCTRFSRGCSLIRDCKSAAQRQRRQYRHDAAESDWSGANQS